MISSATVNNLNNSIVSHLNERHSKPFTSQLQLPVFGHIVLGKQNISLIIFGFRFLSCLWMWFRYVTYWKETDFWRYLQTSFSLFKQRFPLHMMRFLIDVLCMYLIKTRPFITSCKIFWSTMWNIYRSSRCTNLLLSQRGKAFWAFQMSLREAASACNRSLKWAVLCVCLSL